MYFRILYYMCILLVVSYTYSYNTRSYNSRITYSTLIIKRHFIIICFFFALVKSKCFSALFNFYVNILFYWTKINLMQTFCIIFKKIAKYLHLHFWADSTFSHKFLISSFRWNKLLFQAVVEKKKIDFCSIFVGFKNGWCHD